MGMQSQPLQVGWQRAELNTSRLDSGAYKAFARRKGHLQSVRQTYDILTTFWGVVQLVGHLTVNEDGEGSNPSAPAKSLSRNGVTSPVGVFYTDWTTFIPGPFQCVQPKTKYQIMGGSVYGTKGRSNSLDKTKNCGRSVMKRMTKTRTRHINLSVLGFPDGKSRHA